MNLGSKGMSGRLLQYLTLQMRSFLSSASACLLGLWEAPAAPPGRCTVGAMMAGVN